MSKRVQDLSDDEIKTLAGQIDGTKANVYRTCTRMFGIPDVDDVIFDRLEAVAKIFKCESCDWWMPVWKQDSAVKGHCGECVDNMDGDGDDE